jgi:3-oxoacyl-[acyl-carrier-protein] synthase-3
MGTCVPEKVITNLDLEKLVDTTDEWIRTRTGIAERRAVSDGENASDLAVKSAESALGMARVRKRDVDLILVATASPEMIFPSTSCRVAYKLGIKNVPAFDISAACSGFVFGLATATQFINAGTYRTVLLVGTEALTRFVDWSDRNTCVLFGDGAGAVVLQPVDHGYGVLASFLSSDGSGAEFLKIPAGGSLIPGSEDSVRNRMHSIKMNGNEVFKFAIFAMEDAARQVLEIAGARMEDVAFVIPHQANKRITEAAASRLNLDPSRIVSNIEKYGNTSTASIPLALEEIWREGRLKRGDLIMFVGFGAGLTWGANLIRWSMEN